MDLADFTSVHCNIWCYNIFLIIITFVSNISQSEDFNRRVNETVSLKACVMQISILLQ